MKRTLISFALSILFISAFAQDDSTAKMPASLPVDTAIKLQVPLPEDTITSAKKPVSIPVRSYFAAGISYLTNSVYNGRKDSLSTPYLTPTLGYYDKSGFFIDGSASYLSRPGSSRIDLFNIEAGYDFYLGKFDGEVSANKSFYNSASTNVKSEVTGSLFATGAYDFDFIKPSIEAGINFGTQSDYTINFGLEHTFYAASDHLQVTTGFRGNGSTQNYYGSYYNKRKVGGKKKNAGIIYDVTAVVEDASKYKMLDYEFSLPISYTVKKCTFSLVPVYAIPVNPALVTVTLVPEGGGITRTKTSAEVITSSFYCSFGLSYKF